MKGSKNPVLILIPLIILLGIYVYSGKEQEPVLSGEYDVMEVLDGDTIRIDDANNSLVRYIGLDTPEKGLQDAPEEPYSRAATELNRKLVEGKRVRLEYDTEKYDVYGRKLAYVFAGEVFVNVEIVRQGLGTPLFIEPNVKYEDAVNNAVFEAKQEKKGLWSTPRIRPSARHSEFVIDKTKAARYHGKRVIVSGKITDYRKSKKVLSLQMGGDFEIVIFADDLPNFEYFDMDPAEYYMGREVEVTGRVKVHRGTPGIIVNHPILIRRLK